MNANQMRCQVGGTIDDDRPEDDFYPTCPEAVYGLLSKEIFVGRIWECACGDGAISSILIANGNDVFSSDLYDHGYGVTGKRQDFLTCKLPPYCKHIITNPPFNSAMNFMRVGAEHVQKTGGKCCLLGRTLWLEGIARGKLFKETQLSQVWVFSKRLPRMHRPGYAGKKTTSMLSLAWYVWDGNHEGYTTVGWISPEETKE